MQTGAVAGFHLRCFIPTQICGLTISGVRLNLGEAAREKGGEVHENRSKKDGVRSLAVLAPALMVVLLAEAAPGQSISSRYSATGGKIKKVSIAQNGERNLVIAAEDSSGDQVITVWKDTGSAIVEESTGTGSQITAVDVTGFTTFQAITAVIDGATGQMEVDAWGISTTVEPTLSRDLQRFRAQRPASPLRPCRTRRSTRPLTKWPRRRSSGEVAGECLPDFAQRGNHKHGNRHGPRGHLERQSRGLESHAVCHCRGKHEP